MGPHQHEIPQEIALLFRQGAKPRRVLSKLDKPMIMDIILGSTHNIEQVEEQV